MNSATTYGNTSMKLKDKVVIITGGAKGIGFGCASVFDRHGATVVILDKDETAGAEAAQQLQRGHFRACDVTDHAAMHSVIDSTADTLGQLDCIVNNAGWHPPAMSIDDTSVEDFDAQVRLNLTSTFMGCKYALPHLRKTRGSIVIIASFAGELGQPMASAYSATKAGQLGLTRSLASECAADNVRINAISPSNVDTPLMRQWAASLPNPQSALDAVCDTQPTGRMASIEEIGEIGAFLASDEASFITGQSILADLGASLAYGVKRIERAAT